MIREQNIVRALAIYGLVLPLAIFLGYLLATPLQSTTLLAVVLVLLILAVPLILRFHHPLLILSWNMTAVLPLAGRPQLWLVMALVSMTVTVIQYALTRRVRFVKARSILWPLLFLGAVVLATAMFTGGIGMRVMGSEMVGGRKYLIMFAGIIGYLAMTAHEVPRKHANLYLGLFVLGAITNGIGNLLPFAPKAMYAIFAFFPVEQQGINAVLGRESVAGADPSITRFTGGSLAFMALAFFLLARHGLGGLLSLRKPAFWVFMGAVALSMFGGFRSNLILVLMVVGLLFFLEGLHKTKLMPVAVLGILLMGAMVTGFADRLPMSMQRSLSWLPLPVDPAVRMNARVSSEWRLGMWRELLPQVPHYLLLGKGISVSQEDLDMANTLAKQGRGKTAEVSMLAGDFHSGPLSVVITFGIWGVIGWVWLMVAGFRGLYCNLRYGDPEFKHMNRFLFAYFSAKAVMFHFVIGDIRMHLMVFAGILGFSVALNGGIRKPVPATETSEQSEPRGRFARPRLVPSFSRLSGR